MFILTITMQIILAHAIIVSNISPTGFVFVQTSYQVIEVQYFVQFVTGCVLKGYNLLMNYFYLF